MSGHCGAHGWTTGEDPAIDPPWICTLRRRHKGDHVAEGLSDRPIATWADGKPAIKCSEVAR